MKLTPLDIQHKEFHRGLRGYNEEEVDSFLDEVSEEFSQLFKENIELKESLEKLEEKMKQYEGLEQAIQKTLLTAEKSAEEIRSNARKEAEIIFREASLRSREMIASAYRECQQIHIGYANLKQKTQEFSANFKSMLTAFLEMIGKLESMLEKAPEVPLIEKAKEVVEEAPPLTEEMLEELPEEEIPVTEQVVFEAAEEKEEEIPEEPEDVSHGLVKGEKIDEWLSKSKSLSGVFKKKKKREEIVSEVEEEPELEVAPEETVEVEEVKLKEKEEVLKKLVEELPEEKEEELVEEISVKEEDIEKETEELLSMLGEDLTEEEIQEKEKEPKKGEDEIEEIS